MRLAIPDGDPFITDLLKVILEQAGYTVLIFPTIAAFIAETSSNGRSMPGGADTPPSGGAGCDLLVLDYDFVREKKLSLVRNTYADLPILLLSADYLPAEKAVKGWTQVEVLQKPFKIVRLLSIVERLLQ